MTPTGAETAIRDAATLVLLRHDGRGARVLMGQRGAGAAFMPSKFVFPGGAVDPCDRTAALPSPLEAETGAKLALHAGEGMAAPLARAAIRETFEETGLALGRPAEAALPAEVPEGWRGFVARGLLPATDRLRFVFRAVTPPGRTRRFDARFFLADAADLVGDPDDFSGASGELAHLSWIPLGDARGLEIPFITGIVLGEIAEILSDPARPRAVPFFTHGSDRSQFLAL